MNLQRIIKEDKEKVSIWKRDTEEVIQLLTRRRKELNHGEWLPYLEGVGIPQRTAYRLMHPIEVLTQISQMANIKPPGSLIKIDFENKIEYEPLPKQDIQDIEHEEIIQTAEQEEKEFNKEHKPPELKLPKNMPEEYWTICWMLEGVFINSAGVMSLYHKIVNRKKELERIHNNNYPEHKEFYKLYYEWFAGLTEGDKPNMMPRDHANAKRIIIYMRSLGSGDAINNWNAILSNWSKLDKWQQNRTDLTSIHSDLNKIISQLKNGKVNNLKTQRMADYLDGK